MVAIDCVVKQVMIDNTIMIVLSKSRGSRDHASAIVSITITKLSSGQINILYYTIGAALGRRG